NPEWGGVLYASLLLRSGRQAAALPMLAALRDRFPDSALVRTHLACALLMAGEPGKAETELKTIAEDPQSESVGASILRVEALAAQGRIGEVIDQLETLDTPSPEQNMVLAHALVRGDRTEEGDSLIREALVLNPSSGWARFLLGSRLLMGGQHAEAAASLQLAANALPWEPVVMRDLAVARGLVMALSSHPEGDAPGETTAAQAPTPVAESTDDWQALWRQAALRRLLKDRARFMAEGGDHLRETLVLAAYFRGNGALAEELAEELPADSPLNAYREALLDRDPQKAFDALEPWSSQEGHLQILAMNAVGYAVALAGARGQAAKILSACWERHPDNGVSLFNLARIFRTANMPKFAAQALRRLTAAFPENMETHVLLFQVLREAGMQQEARQAAEAMYALFPQSREATLALCGIYVDFKQLEQARRVVEAYLVSHPDDPEMRLTLASVLFREDRVGEALKVLDETTSPGNIAPGITTLTALSHAAMDNWQRVIDVAGSSDPKSMSLPARFILVAAYTKMGQKDEAAAVLTRADEEAPFGGRVGAIILNALSRSTIVLTDAEAALSNALAPNDRALVDFASGAAYQVAKLHDAAYLAFRRVDSALPGDDYHLLTFLFASLPNVTRIKELGQEAQLIAEKHATRPGAWLGCAAVYRRIEDVGNERAALDKAAEVGPDNPVVFLRRGDFFAGQKDIGTAITEYRRLLQLRPDDPVGNNNLAYHLLLTGGDLTDALNAAQLAAKGLPYNSHVLHTLGVAQLRAGDLEQSKVNLTSALERRPGDPSLLLDYGQLLIALGDAENGYRHIESALKSTRILGLDFDRRAEAEAILAKTPVPKPAPEEATSGPV
ncbi:MAG: tetratricopeptide repeat protein, partial [Nitrospiraceae bacterium]|nr:tetratricopeptide repeat protein [Nitrospiraceae bacterium]